MTVLSAQTLRRLKIVRPFIERSVDPVTNTSYGLSCCGVDIRLDQNIYLRPGEFSLASSMENFHMPTNVAGLVKDKSSWARRGLSCFNTIIEPNWSGILTLELVNHSKIDLNFWRGTPIAQVIFEYLDEPTELPYTGKYQNQRAGPQEAL